jgi:hypothetical protein
MATHERRDVRMMTHERGDDRQRDDAGAPEGKRR